MMLGDDPRNWSRLVEIRRQVDPETRRRNLPRNSAPTNPCGGTVVFSHPARV